MNNLEAYERASLRWAIFIAVLFSLSVIVGLPDGLELVK